MNRKYPKRKDYIIVLCTSIFFIIAGTFMFYNFVKELGFLFAIIALGVGIAIGLPIIKSAGSGINYLIKNMKNWENS